MVKTIGKTPGGRRPGLISGVRKPVDSRARGMRTGRDLLIVTIVGILFIVVFAAVFLRPPQDRGVRLWMLNHGPDQLIVINPDTGESDKEMLVADGLQQVIFNHRKDTAFVANVVDVSNRITLIDTRSYLKADQLIVEGVPQGLAIFPDDRYLAVIMGNKTDFMAGGFDVLDLQQASSADPTRKRVAYHERNLSLTAFIAVDEWGENIFCLDAKASELFIFSMSQKKLVRTIDIEAAPMGLLYPEQGDYFFVSSISNESIAVFNKAKDAKDINIVGRVVYKRFRNMALSPDATTLYAPVMESKEVAVIEVASLKVVKAHKTPEAPTLIAVSPDGLEIYAVSMDSGNVFVMDSDSGELKRTIPTHGEFRDIKVILNSDKPATGR